MPSLTSRSFFNLAPVSFLLIWLEREKHRFIVPSIYAFNGCLLYVPWLRIIQTHNLGVLKWCSNQLSYSARALFNKPQQSLVACLFSGILKYSKIVLGISCSRTEIIYFFKEYLETTIWILIVFTAAVLFLGFFNVQS